MSDTPKRTYHKPVKAMCDQGKKTFEKKADRKARLKAEAGAQLTPEQRAYRERNTREQSRMSNTTEGDIWTCLCFLTAQDLAAFAAQFNLPNATVGARIWVGDIDWSPWKPALLKRVFTRPDVGADDHKLPAHPFDAIDYSGNLETDLRMEFDAIFRALTCCTPPAGMQDPRNSDIYVVVVFPSEEYKRQWLHELGLTHLGSKYLDGYRLALALAKHTVT